MSRRVERADSLLQENRLLTDARCLAFSPPVVVLVVHTRVWQADPRVLYSGVETLRYSGKLASGEGYADRVLPPVSLSSV